MKRPGNLPRVRSKKRSLCSSKNLKGRSRVRTAGPTKNSSGSLLSLEIARIAAAPRKKSACCSNAELDSQGHDTPLFLFLSPPAASRSFVFVLLPFVALRYALVARPALISHPSTSHFRRKHVRNGQSFSLSFWRYDGGYTCVPFCDRRCPSSIHDFEYASYQPLSHSTSFHVPLRKL